MIEYQDVIVFLKRFLELDDQTILLKVDDMLSGFCRKLDKKIRKKIVSSIISSLPPTLVIRFFKCLPFERADMATT